MNMFLLVIPFSNPWSSERKAALQRYRYNKYMSHKAISIWNVRLHFTVVDKKNYLQQHISYTYIGLTYQIDISNKHPISS